MSCVIRGHIKEANVLLESHLDSTAKHKRNLVLAIWAIATVIFFPLGLTHLCQEIHRELCIREINQKYPTMGYSKCVELSACTGSNGVMHKGVLVNNPIDLDSKKEKLRSKLTRVAFDISLVALVLIGVAGAIIIGI